MKTLADIDMPRTRDSSITAVLTLDNGRNFTVVTNAPTHSDFLRDNLYEVIIPSYTDDTVPPAKIVEIHFPE
jgi:hypothetical protein